MEKKKFTLKDTATISYPTGEIRHKAKILEYLGKIKGILESKDDVYVFNDKGLKKTAPHRKKSAS